jgi:hypothetical protein
MKQTRLLVLASLVVSGSAVAGPISPAAPGVAERGIGAQLLAPSQGKDVPLACSGGRGSVGHIVTNTTSFPVPKGTVLHWNTSPSLSGNLKLTTDLAPGGTVEVASSGPTNGYACTAHFFAGPADFVVKEILWGKGGDANGKVDGANADAKIVVANRNPWTDGEAAVARVVTVAVEFLGCTMRPSQVLQQIPAIAAGGTAMVTVPLTTSKKFRFVFVAVTVNYDGKTIESNQENNTTYWPLAHEQVLQAAMKAPPCPQ